MLGSPTLDVCPPVFASVSPMLRNSTRSLGGTAPPRNGGLYSAGHHGDGGGGGSGGSSVSVGGISAAWSSACAPLPPGARLLRFGPPLRRFVRRRFWRSSSSFGGSIPGV